MNLSEKIRYYRNNLKITQQELADKAEISLRALSNYEKGVRVPSMEVLIKIAKALDIPVEKLQPQLIKSPEITYLFAGSGKLVTEDIENFDKNVSHIKDQLTIANAINLLLKKSGHDLKDFTEDEYKKIEKSLIEYLDTIASMKK